MINQEQLQTELKQQDEAELIKEHVRNIYGKLAKENTQGKNSGVTNSCCGAPIKTDVEYSQTLGYSAEDAASVPEGANLGLGCGNPHAIAQLKPGETVLDLGSGAGFDCFLASKRVGSTGHVIGVDMTPDMLQKARANAKKGNYTNVEFRLGEIEALPVADNSVDAIISNCVVNLAPNKPQVYKEAARVLKPGGRIAISDVVATIEMPEQIKKDFELYSGCMAGATPIKELEKALKDAGFENAKIIVNEESRSFIKGWAPTSGAENYVASATIEANKPQLVLKKTEIVTLNTSDSISTSEKLTKTIETLTAANEQNNKSQAESQISQSLSFRSTTRSTTPTQSGKTEQQAKSCCQPGTSCKPNF